ncbi:hypothetical protein Hanom_Chr14g01308401 [Helianthus anomalus]
MEWNVEIVTNFIRVKKFIGFQIPPSPNQDQFYKEKLPNSIPFHSMKRTLPKS